jgi:nitroreductase
MTTDDVSLFDALLTTRAMRRFTDEPVSRDDLEACLRAAVQAPSGGNIQPWHFVVVDDGAVRADLAALYQRCYARYEAAMLPTATAPRSPEDGASWDRTVAAAHHLAEHFAEVPVIVAACVSDIDLTLTDDIGPLDIGSVLGSVFPAIQNFILAARSRGLGTSLTTVHRIEQQACRDILGVPERLQIVALLPVGHPRGTWGVARRRPAQSVTSWNRYGNREPFAAADPATPAGGR